MALATIKKLSALALAAALAACGGGGGGGVVEARVTNVAAAQVMEGTAGNAVLSFAVTLDKAAVSPVRIDYTTNSTAKSGGGSTGFAVGGAACNAGVDYITTTATVMIPAGASTSELKVTVCADSTFEPTETMLINWNTVDASGTAIGTILNDDAGGLNGTGLATSFGRDSNPLTNSDADGRLGFSFAKVPSATDFQCTRDNVTGLLWENKVATTGNVHDAARTYTYAELAALVTAVNAQALCGFTDWRVPTPEELSSIVDPGVNATPTIDANFFPNTRATRYWTSTSYRDGVAQDAWFVDFASGSVAVDNKARSFAARLVTRGGTAQAAALPASCTDATRFSLHGDGTVTDNRTGLMWKQCAEGFTGGTCTGTGAALTWDAALTRPAAVNADASLGLGYKDWRLPTRNELSSIAEREQCFNPAINASVFPNSEPLGYWSSTPYALNGALAWSVDFFDGQVAPGAKTGAGSSAKRVRLVRAGQ